LVSNNVGSTAEVKGNNVMNWKMLAQQQLWPSSKIIMRNTMDNIKEN